MSALRINSLSYQYGKKQALNDVSLALAEGQFYALLGPNGAGKSTLFSLICQLLTPSKDTISVFGFDVAKKPRQALANMGVVFQQSTLDLDLTVAQNLLYHASLHGLSRATAVSRMSSLLLRFELSERSQDKVRNLNGGHRRRVEIARALLHEPRLLLLDEASAGLDQPSREGINRHMRELCRDKGITVLASTHQIDEITASDNLIVIQDGRIVLDQPCKTALTELGADTVQTLYRLVTVNRMVA